MKAVLLDSNALLFTLYQSKRLGPRAVARIEQAENSYVSIASVWELAIKYNNGHIAISPRQLLNGIEKLGLTLLTIAPQHITQLEHIELPQKDPFDRMLVAQSEAEDCTFMTADQHILSSKYRVFDITK